VIWAYLEEIPRMVAGSDVFEVFTHIDYPIRHWPEAREGPFDPRVFEEGFRTAMRAIADSGRALEMNTRRLWSTRPLPSMRGSAAARRVPTTKPPRAEMR